MFGTRKTTTDGIDWLSCQDATKLWADWKDLEPLSIVANGKEKDAVLPLTHPRTPKALRCVCVSDTHSRPLSHMKLPAGDVLVHAGDLTMYGSEPETREFDQELEKLLKAKLFSKIVVIAGNHDEYLETFVSYAKKKDDKPSPQPLKNCIYLRDQAVTLCGVKFYGAPWVPVYRKWAFMLKRGDQIDEVWKAIPEDTDVLITHTPPLGALDVSHRGPRAGCLSLMGHVLNRVKPQFHVFGHIHESHGVLKTTGTTTFINAAICDKSYRPINSPVVFDVPIPEGHSKRELFRSPGHERVAEDDAADAMAQLTLSSL